MKKIIITIIAILAFFPSKAQLLPCNTLNVTWAATPTPADPYNVTFTNSTPMTTPGTYFYDLVFYNPYYQIISLQNSQFTQYSHSFPGPGTYQVGTVLYFYPLGSPNPQCHDSVHLTITLAPTPCYTTISTANNGSGSYTFTANNAANTPGMSYMWTFGDGGTATGSPATHTYNAYGSYNVSLIATGGGCTDTANTLVNYYAGSLNCSQLNTNFTHSQGSGGSVSFSNTSTNLIFSNPPVKREAHWNFGDGSASVTGNTPSHTYAANGTYNVVMTHFWIDTVTLAVLCTDTVAKSVTVSSMPLINQISGTVHWDTLNSTPMQTSVRVWLIVHDSLNATLTAVDSTDVGGALSASYSFNNKVGGKYLTKAAVLAGSPGNNTLVPTYHDSSLYWNGGQMIFHIGSYNPGNDIYMKQGIGTSGPGFIGGNISQGANKGTGAGVPNLLVMLRDHSNELVQFTFTDANGDYAFSSLGAGTYNVYPEEMNYITTPSSSLTIGPGQFHVTGLDFKQTPTDIKPISLGVTEVAINNLFTVYPNPSKGNIIINWTSTITGIANVQVLDMTGRQVYTQNTNMAKPAVLNLSNVQSGIYFIRISNGTTQHTEKIILQNK